MKLVLSRKGFDSENGGVPSPIFPDGTFQSLPIPAHAAPKTYGELNPGGLELGNLVAQLTQGRISSTHLTHFDPDLDETAMPRLSNWRGAFGQTNAAQGHLRKQGVGVDDLFLFFGWFRAIEEYRGNWRYRPGAPDLHVVFGWLQVGEVLSVGAATEAFRTRYAWLRDHPHLHGERASNNTIYLARDTLRLPHGPHDIGPGAGTFKRLSPRLVLTAPGQKSRRVWQLPRWFYPSKGRTPLTYNANPANWSRDETSATLISAAKGQEFVLDCRGYPEVCEWLQSMIEME